MWCFTVWSTNIATVCVGLFFPDRHGLDVPDSLCMMKDTESAQDPFFGLMESHQLPSPYKIHQVQLLLGYQCSHVLYMFVWL